MHSTSVVGIVLPHRPGGEVAANVKPEVKSFVGGPQGPCAYIPIPDAGPWLPALGVLAGADVVLATASVCLVSCADGSLTHSSDDSQG